MKEKMRLDHALVQRSLVSTRSQSQDLIRRGKVKVNGVTVTKAAFNIMGGDILELDQEVLYVSRGALKLLGALKDFNVSLPLSGIAIDAGASTGGFTQILLQFGMSKVYALEGGHGQLHPTLELDQRVVSIEKINLKFPFQLPEKVDWLVVDLSFISLWSVMPNLWPWLLPGARSIILFKPQFELGPAGVDGRGRVKDQNAARERVSDFIEWARNHGQSFIAMTKASIQGKEGNQEYLLYFQHQQGVQNGS